jgi:putative tryptophan/tyrosine transport system substrate-binding protein
MRRREFLIGGAAIALASPVQAQRSSIPIVGLLHSGSEVGYTARIAAFRSGLKDAGLVEGQDFQIEFRWANGNYQALLGLARELVSRGVSVLVAAGGVASAPAAKLATTTIPIVFITGADPVATGMVPNLARPGGNVTGVNSLTQALGSKRLGLLKLLAPDAKKISVLINPLNSATDIATKELTAAAQNARLQIQTHQATTDEQIASVFTTLKHQKTDALLVHSDPFFTSRHANIASNGNTLRIPAIYPSREYVEAGGLASYGADIRVEYHEGGVYAGRILRGSSPSEMPILQPTKFELVLNLKTATKLGIELPNSIQLLADEVIE